VPRRRERPRLRAALNTSRGCGGRTSARPPRVGQDHRRTRTVALTVCTAPPAARTEGGHSPRAARADAPAAHRGRRAQRARRPRAGAAPTRPAPSSATSASTATPLSSSTGRSSSLERGTRAPRSPESQPGGLRRMKRTPRTARGTCQRQRFGLREWRAKAPLRGRSAARAPDRKRDPPTPRVPELDDQRKRHSGPTRGTRRIGTTSPSASSPSVEAQAPSPSQRHQEQRARRAGGRSLRPSGG
jgi:hypothetical protein